MYLNIKIGCSICRYFENKTIQMPFDSADNTCPKCGELDTMYIVSVNDTSKIGDLYNAEDKRINQLLKLRQI